jgi:hypothetical protein
MPGVKGMKWGSRGLTIAQRTRLEEVVLRDGIGLGVTAMHYKLSEEMEDAPAREEVGEWMRSIPSAQVAQMPREIAGPENAVQPVIPPPQPLSRCFCDSYFLPASYHVKKKGKSGVVYKAGILFCDALTKFVHVEPVAFLQNDRPMSSVARDGFIEFIRKARAISGIKRLHPLHVRTDGGSEWKGVFTTWMEGLHGSHPEAYTHSRTTGGRASGNSVGERHIQTIRRLQYAHYRSVKRQWDLDGVPLTRRRYNWVEHLPKILETYNGKYHSAIKTTPTKALAPGEPDYEEVQRRIIRAAAKVYGKRETNREQPAFSKGSRVLAVGALVRRSIWKKGLPGKSSWVDSKKASAGTNSWSSDVYRVSSVNTGLWWSNYTYKIADLDDDNGIGDDLAGEWTRQQLLDIPEDTLRYVDAAVADADEDVAEAPINDVGTNDPRPPRANDYRYRVGDALRFKAEFFLAGPRGIAGLRTKALRVERVGVVKARTRERARGANRGKRFYTIAFETPSLTVPLLPAAGEGGVDTHDAVDLVDLVGEGRKRKRAGPSQPTGASRVRYLIESDLR